MPTPDSIKSEGSVLNAGNLSQAYFARLTPGSGVLVQNLTNEPIDVGYIPTNPKHALTSLANLLKSRILPVRIILKDGTEVELNGSEDTVRRMLEGVSKRENEYLQVEKLLSQLLHSEELVR